MSDPIREVNWSEKSQVVDSLLDCDSSFTVASLDSGVEAEVTKIIYDETSFVLKVWNKSFKSDVENQYNLMKALFAQGVSVSQPLGWGVDSYHNQVLLTSYDGLPVKKVNQSKLNKLAKILTDIHSIPLEELSRSYFNKNDFISYFYPRIDKHKDIYSLLKDLLAISNIKQNKLIHGDYNLGNILEYEGKYTIIDWTNGQVGDPRYDIAWAVILMKIYVGQRYGMLYHSIFLTITPYTADELELFEAMACLRWILLNRIANLPRGKETIKRVRSLITSNKHLYESLIDK